MRAPRRSAVLHPVPSAINAVLVGVLALIAGGTAVVALTLATAMLGFQFSIGALNDVVDAEQDRVAGKGRPIPMGLVSPRLALAIVVIGGLAGLLISAGFGVAVLATGAAGYASGLAYDLVLRRYGLGWIGFAVAFPMLLSWTWLAAAGSLPPGWPFLLLVAAIAGPAIHLANSLVDVDVDDQTGASSLATRLGPGRAERVLAGLVALVYGLAWASILLLGELPGLAIVAGILATLTAAVGVALSGQPRAQAREAGWLVQAGGLALMAVAWLAAITHVSN